MPQINPEILKWARTTAGLSLAQAAHGLFGASSAGKGEKRLADIEAGIEQPTRTLLNKMAKKYNRPILTFYLEKPPKRSERGEDFRTLPNPVSDLVDANLDALLRKVKASQEVVRDLLEDEETEPLTFIRSATVDDDPEKVAKEIARTIDFDVAQFRARRSIEDAFRYLRDKVQEAGVFVILAQNLGSYHTNIPVDVFRGFVISDPIAPFIVVNDGDAATAWSFTLLHELTHLWLGTTGISGGIQAQGNNMIERFCNQVAALILLPSEEISELEHIHAIEFDNTVDEITQFAKKRNISRSMVAYTLFLDGKITYGVWVGLADKFRQEWLERRKQRKIKEGRKIGGPDYYVVQRSKLGKELTGLADRAMNSGRLTPSKASVVLLGVKPGNVHALLTEHQPKGKG